MRSSINDPYSLSDNAVYSLCKDREGGIWIGSYFGGVNYYPRFYTYFEKYYPKGTDNGLHGKRVREFCQDNQGILWIGTEDGGLNRFDPKTKTFSFFTPSNAFTNVHGLCLIGDHLWVGTFAKGVKVIDTDELENFIKTHGIKIAALTIPKDQAPAIAKKMAEWGIKGFWNFAPIDLHLPDNVTVENVHLAESLMTLTYNVHNREESENE